MCVCVLFCMCGFFFVSCFFLRISMSQKTVVRTLSLDVSCVVLAHSFVFSLQAAARSLVQAVLCNGPILVSHAQ